jgi:hypothetical protein
MLCQTERSHSEQNQQATVTVVVQCTGRQYRDRRGKDLFLQQEEGHGFSLYKNSSIYCRLKRRMCFQKTGGIATQPEVGEEPAPRLVGYKRWKSGTTTRGCRTSWGRGTSDMSYEPQQKLLEELLQARDAVCQHSRDHRSESEHGKATFLLLWRCMERLA